MIWKMYSIRDAKAEIFKPPFFKSTHGEAERDYRTLCNDTQSLVNRYPEDFDLWFIGTYDDTSGKMESLATPQHIIKAVQCIQNSTPQLVPNLGDPAQMLPSDVVRQ